ncbi:MAG: TAT-variant-translocated molybdopterin oxidoreductase [Verrucomicrobiales bacterium]
MKRVLQHPEEPATGRKYWRSLGQMQDTEESRQWVEREFPDGVSEMTEDEASVSRRNFMKLMGAATSMAGMSMAACRRPESFIKPYAQGVEWIIPGKSLLYATAMPWVGGCVPLVVTTFEGRPTHLQGNTLHPLSNGGLDSYTQSSILDLYDPDRSRGFIKTVDEVDPISKEVTYKQAPATREEFDKFFANMKEEAVAAQGKGVALLLDHDTSPTRRRLLAKLQAKLPQAKIYRYEAISDANVVAATEQVFGAGVRQVVQFDQADKILALDCDFMGGDRLTNNATSQFMSGRKAENPGDAMNRLYVLEGRYTVTGGMADHRLRVNTSQTMKAAVGIAIALAEKTGNADLRAAADAVRLVGDYSPRNDYQEWLAAAAEDLAASPGKSVVVAGVSQPVELHLLVAAMNAALGAFGSTVKVLKTDMESVGTLADLASSIGAGEVQNLIIMGEADPVYDAPADLKWEAAQKSVPTVVHVGRRNLTATARAAKWHVPGTHYLEQWGDARSADGTYSVVQPMILPLYDGISDLTFLGMLLAEDAAEGDATANVPTPDPAYLAVLETFSTLGVQGDVEAVWSKVLRDGFLVDSGYPAATGTANTGAIAAALAGYQDVAPPTLTAMEVTFVPDSKVYDGRFVNNGWLQEAPDPISKITWDNVALMSLKTAEAFGVNLYTVDEANVIKVVVGDQTQWFPVLPAPGHVDNAITIALGYGQGSGENGPGRVGDGVGVNANVLRTSTNSYWASGADILRVKDSVETPDGREIEELYEIATTQEHHTVYGRAIVREGNLEDFNGENDGFFAKQGMDAHIPENTPLYKPVGLATEEYPDGKPNLWDKSHQWAMTIDLNSCIGCNSCLIACQSENNIPIVGKDQVRRGREMHWIRMDRYFAVDLDGGHQTDGEEWDRLPKGGGHAAAEGHGDGHGGGHSAERVRELDDPEMLVQPMACQQCESASCETVCPVNATVHSPDGLNVMAYNRCIGTRYCANNCPYKARRFNFFDYNKRDPLAPSKTGIPYLFSSNLYDGPIGERQDARAPHLQKNPNVTVRMRGVMEKCTYCIQRIQEGKINAKKGLKKEALATGAPSETVKVDEVDLRVATDSVKTACQVACPADAIVFGNKLDPKSAVNKTMANRRNYSVLKYVGNLPRTTYLARIKNPNPELLKVSEIEKRKVGQASSHIH